MSLDTNSDTTLVNSRVIPATPDEILAAYRDPERLARWWGPAGFRNTFHTFDFRPGGEWVFDMHGPDGRNYPNRSRFEETGPDRVVLTHLETVHRFTLTMALEPADGGTLLTWTMAFDTAEECERVRPYVPRCNEENLDRLEAELSRPSP